MIRGRRQIESFIELISENEINSNYPERIRVDNNTLELGWCCTDKFIGEFYFDRKEAGSVLFHNPCFLHNEDNDMIEKSYLRVKKILDEGKEEIQKN